MARLDKLLSPSQSNVLRERCPIYRIINKCALAGAFALVLIAVTSLSYNSAGAARVIRLAAVPPIGHIKPGKRRRPHRHARGTFGVREANRLAAPLKCRMVQFSSNAHHYRKMVCTRRHKVRFPALRPWDYRHFRKLADQHQSRDWGGRFHPHHRYLGDLGVADHSGLIAGNPRQWAAPNNRYGQSPDFGRNIFFPRPAWE